MQIKLKNKTINISEEDKKELLKQLNKISDKIRPENGEEYYHVSSGNNRISEEKYNCEYAFNSWNAGDGYFTKEEAQNALDIRLAIQRVEDYILENDLYFEPNWEDKNEEKYSLYYDYIDKDFFVAYDSHYREYSPIGYFKSDEDIQQVIYNCGNDLRIIYNIK